MTIIVGKIKSISYYSLVLTLPFKNNYYMPTFQLSESLSFFDNKKVSIKYNSFNSLELIEKLKKEGKLDQKLKSIEGLLRTPNKKNSTDLDEWTDSSVTVIYKNNNTFSFNDFFMNQIGKVLYIEVLEK